DAGRVAVDLLGTRFPRPRIPASRPGPHCGALPLVDPLDRSPLAGAVDAFVQGPQIFVRAFQAEDLQHPLAVCLGVLAGFVVAIRSQGIGDAGPEMRARVPGTKLPACREAWARCSAALRAARE